MLTDTKLKALKPRDRVYIVTDSRGLYVEVFPTGGVIWRCRYRLNGKQEKVTIGKYPSLTLKDARVKRDELMQLAARGKSPAKEKQLIKQRLSATTTVREFGERYYNEVVVRDRKDPTDMLRCLSKDIYPAIGEKSLQDVTVADIQRLVDMKKAHGFEAAAVSLRGVLKRLFDYAVARQVVDKNPAAALPTRFIAKLKARDRALTPEEIRTYLRTLYQSSIRQQFKLGLHLILLTLVRKSELLNARWEHVHLDEGFWEIPAENSKTGKPHLVFLSRQSVEVFRELQFLSGTSPLVLPGRSSLDKPFAHNALNHALDGVTFPIAHFTIHDMRRTASTLLHERGFVSDVIEKALNHTMGGVRGVYNRAEYADQRRDMLQWWGDYVDSLAVGSTNIVHFRRAG
jgi:integrase